MYMYYLNIALILIAYFLIYNSRIKNKKLYFCIWVFIQLTLILGMRWGIGTDYFSYESHYQKVIQEGLFYSEFEPGFNFLNLLADRLGTGFQGVIAISSAITIACVVYAVYQCSDSPCLSVILYLTFGFYCSAMNQIRACMAVSISLAAISFLLKGKTLKYIICILAASLFHITALCLLPFLMIIRLRWRTRQFVFATVLAVTAIFFVDPVIRLGVRLYPRYESYIGSVFDKGYGLQSLLLVGIGLFLMLAYKRQLLKEDKDAIIFENFALYGFVIALFQLKLMMMDRFVAYFTAPVYILGLPLVTKCYREKRKKWLFSFALFLLGILYCTFTLARNWNGVVPYQVFLGK